MIGQRKARSLVPEGDIWAGIEIDWVTEDAPSLRSIANATRLLEVMAPTIPPPEVATRGYWPTTRLLWQNGAVEIEVFEDRFELYSLPTSPKKGPFDIFEFDGQAQADLSELLTKLKQLLDDVGQSSPKAKAE